MSDRPIRGCDVCGQEDDHPRHEYNDLGRGGDFVRHIDCCASMGCESCIASEAANGNRRGQELIDYLEETRG